MKYYLLSLKWSAGKGKYVWWGPDSSGYTEDLNKAGVYTEEDLAKRTRYYRNTGTYPVPVETVKQMITQTVVPTLSGNWDLMKINLSELKEY
ncbi:MULTISPECIES: hypothetical protein [Paenibacillus]|uniref:Uncharacterized protein n=1 Tax=Paenibacillus pabuli TaxID=1472 RepID=A0A855Y6Y5_9BACL|nr:MULTISPECIES: hypothetical protein [Paenibacillus]PWW37361.1 hypothetical protein DET56_109247 [Paenibacillus pabuli]PXW05503.1 hypothetical protein DEU73_108246 [Paenibacillus taichungensis]